MSLQEVHRLVVKVGTNTLAQGRGKADPAQLSLLADQVAALRQQGLEVILVSSGAVGLGMGALGLDKRPSDLPTLQACAAIGQALLMDGWRQAFAPHGLTCAQVLLTRDDVRHRERHLNVRATLERLLRLGVVPIINENDTVSVAEVKFGDNDILSALVASLTQAQLLVILTSVRGLLDRSDGDRLISVVEAITPAIEALAGGTDSPTAVGGMSTKIAAARVATQSGCGVFIGDGRQRTLLPDLVAGKAEGTFFVPRKVPLQSRKRWIAFFERPQGTLRIDAGAVEALREQGKSLLAKGITGCEGTFPEGSLISIAGPDGVVFARGLSRYSAAEVAAIAGQKSEAIQARFPERKHLEVVHRSSLVLLS